MAENPLQALCQTLEKISNGFKTQLSQFNNSGFGLFGIINNNSFKKTSSSHNSLKHKNTTTITTTHQVFDTSPHPNLSLNKRSKATPASKEVLGRATWTFLHTLGAQYPDKPTRQQRRDVKELMEILSRMYPCKDCADHFKEILRSNPVQAGSQAELSQWLCHVHNVVNRSLGKVTFQCERVDARWGKLECEQRACDLQETTSFGDDIP